MRFAGLILALVIGAGSCGYVGDPLPPAFNIPKPIDDLRVVQIGSKMEVAFTIPRLTTEDLPVENLSGVDLRIGPHPEGGWNPDMWAANARPVVVEERNPGPATTSADVADFAGKDVVIAVRLANRKGRLSAWSNLATAHIEPLIVTPPQFIADSAPAGAVVKWSGFDGPVAVYRDGTYLGDGAAGTYNDNTAALGKTYAYEIQAKRGSALGEKSGPVSVTVEDRFPPAAPTGVTPVAGAGTVELTWDRGPEADILAYAVLRAAGDGPFMEVAPSVDAPAYTDRDVKSGASYRYKVAAIDLRRNRSELSKEVEITVP